LGKYQAKIIRGAVVLIALSLLSATYVFQGMNFSNWLGIQFKGNENTSFIVNKTFRLLVNDFSSILLIHALFNNPKYNWLAFYVFLVELLVILPGYLFLKLAIEGSSEISSPILSQIHRLIVNPMLMAVLIASFYYQKNFSGPRD